MLHTRHKFSKEIALKVFYFHFFVILRNGRRYIGHRYGNYRGLLTRASGWHDGRKKSKSGGSEGRKKTSLEKVKLMKESVFANLGKRGTVSAKERSTVKSVPGENKKIFIYNFFP